MSRLRQQGARAAALLVVLALWGFARVPEPGPGERRALARRFAFEGSPLPDLPGPPARTLRPVHPSLQGISAWISSVGAAVALNDLDGDGLPNDVCHVDPRSDQVIVSPAPGTGERFAPFALDPRPLPFDRDTMAPMGCLPGDLDEDGRVDLLVYYWGRTPVLFLHGSREMTPAAWIPGEVVAGGQRWYSSAATLADLDGDGHVDVVVGNYFPDGARILDAADHQPQSMQDSMSLAYNGGGPWLLLWKSASQGATPAVRFEASRADLSRQVRGGWVLAVGAADLDGDLLPELYLADDFGPDHLLHNLSVPGRLRFELLEGRRTLWSPKSKVLGHDSFKGMGVDFGDLNGDGLPDIVVSDIGAEYALEESNLAFASTGQLGQMRDGIAPYLDVSERLGLSRGGWAWDVKLADFDNDGALEMLQAAGYLRGSVNRWPELQELAMGNDQLVSSPLSWGRFQPGDDLCGHDRNPFFVRSASGRFVDVSGELGLAEPAVSRGIAIADVDEDGRLDYAVANQWGASTFHHNGAPAGNGFLGLHLRLPLEPGPLSVHPGDPSQDAPSRPAIGATARVQLPDGRGLAGQVDGGNGHSGKRSPDLHFGLGPRPPRECRVELRWRDPNGSSHRDVLALEPGWHTVRLGWER